MFLSLTWFMIKPVLSCNVSDGLVSFSSCRNDFSTTQQAVEVDSIVLTCPEISGTVHRSP